MSHYVQAFITRISTFRHLPASCRSPYLHVAALPQSFGLMPLVDELVAEMAASHPTEDERPLESFYRLGPSIVELGRRMSRIAPVAYIETDYIGGKGSQAAVVWDRGAVALGPLITDTRGAIAMGPVITDTRSAINLALRRLGVQRGNARDEYEALELGRCRSNGEWAACAEHAAQP